MDADTVLRIRPALTDYLKEFDDCFGRVTTRRQLDTYAEGQLSDFRRKSVKPIADAAGIPDEVVYRPKHQIVLGQVRRALSNGIRFAWLTFDEGYGGKPPFLRGLDALGQNYVAELPGNFMARTRRPAVRYRAHGRERRIGRPPRYPRLKTKSNPTVEVRHVLGSSPRLRRVPWQRYRVKEGSKGPEVWEVKTLVVWLKDEQGLPTAPHLLVVARQVPSGEAKFFLSNVPQAPTETLLAVAFSWWRIERMFEDTKGELGMDHFEVRHTTRSGGTLYSAPSAICSPRSSGWRKGEKIRICRSAKSTRPRQFLCLSGSAADAARGNAPRPSAAAFF